MAKQNAMTPTASAIEAAQEFKRLLDMQPAEQLFWPKRLGGNLFASQTYRQAAALLDQAIAQGLKRSNGISFERVLLLPIVDVVSNDSANVPANQLELFANITAGIAQLVIQVLEERGSSGEHGGFFEIGVRFARKLDVAGQQVEREGDVVHGADPKEVGEKAFCHEPNAAKGGR